VLQLRAHRGRERPEPRRRQLRAAGAQRQAEMMRTARKNAGMDGKDLD